MNNTEDNKNESKKAPVVVVKRVIKKNAHHGGAWKLAYADFVTAMMAFFLVLWLIGLLNQTQKKNIAEYFKRPLREAFIRNQPNDSNIPSYFETPSLKSELAPIRMDLNNPINEMNESKEQKESSLIETHTENTYSKESNKAGLGEKIKDYSELIVFQNHLITALKTNKELAQYAEQLDFKIVDDGLRINLKSLEYKPMFSLGGTDFENYAYKIVSWLSKELDRSDKMIAIVGHTDGQPYANNGYYSNWELSADRAASVRRYLVKYGLDQSRIIRVEGAGDRNLLDKKNPYHAKNRRIEIILLTDKAAKKMLNQ